MFRRELFIIDDSLNRPVEEDEVNVTPSLKQRTIVQPTAWKPGVIWEGDEGEIITPTSTLPYPHWDDILFSWGYDPAQYEIVEPVKVSVWDQQSKEGVEKLWSYRAGIRQKRNTKDTDYEDLIREIKKHRPLSENLPEGENTFVVCIADTQFGKNDGDGLKGTVDRFLRAIDEIDQRIRDLRKIGRKLGHLIVAGLGDIIENCLAGETEVITSAGIKTLKELAEIGTARVITDNGKWVDAEFKSFGVQPLKKVTLTRNGATKVIYATSGHVWVRTPAPNYKKEKVITNDLVVGDRLPCVFGSGMPLRLDPFGVASGIVFGDGNKDAKGSQITLCADKEELIKWFPLSYTRTSSGGNTVVCDLPSFMKDKPSLTESPTYLAGWLAGYIAADGCTSGQCIKLDSTKLDNLLFARDVAAVLGVGTQPIRSHIRMVKLPNSDSVVQSTIYSLTFVQATVPEWMIIKDSHKINLTFSSKRNRLNWIVKSIEKTDRYEEVYCAIVPNTHTFTLADNLLTGNCVGNYASQTFRVEINLRQQLRIARRLIRDAIAKWSKQFQSVTILAIPGNHGANKPNGKEYTTPGDNFDVAVFESVAEIFSANPKAYGHVKFILPEDEVYVTLDISGVPVGFAHGHISAGGGTPQARLKNWWESHAFGNTSMGQTDILITGHYHHLSVIQYGSKTHIICPTLDGGSEYFVDQTGLNSPPGMLSLVIGKTAGPGGFSDLLIV